MIMPRHTSLYIRFFNWYIKRILRSDFHDVRVVGDISLKSTDSILLIPNHFSWWDGFFAWHLNRVLLQKRFHVMMLEEQLSKHRFFSKIGAFSVNPHSREIVESLTFAYGLLRSKGNLLVFFPQGKFYCQHIAEYQFYKGVERLVPQSAPCKTVFANVIIDYFENRKPTAVIHVKEVGIAGLSASEIAKEYTAFANDCRLNQQKLFKQ